MILSNIPSRMLQEGMSRASFCGVDGYLVGTITPFAASLFLVP